MATYELIISDVTRYGTLYCVAGWDLGDGGMVRPEPPGANIVAEASRFWDASHAGPGRLFSVGNVVRFEASAPPQAFPYPHATEDRIFVSGTKSVLVKQVTIEQIRKSVAAGVSPSVENAFGGKLIQKSNGKAYVAAGEKVCSLDAIEIVPEQISFYAEVTQAGKRRLRAVIEEDGIEYDLSVPADAARTRFLAGGVAALEADAKASDLIHVRLGLCRPFAAMPDACYAQVNGLYFL
ncbi:MAG TPA: hypothetical protein VKS60_03915 [Stellaceae bacterium]|nr:hypothetical protein [Stellaceae bacterium]